MSHESSPIPVPAPPDRPADGHKGVFGTVIVVGGCATMPGAPALCATAAFRAGAGLVKIAASREVLKTAIGIEPGATGIVLGDDAPTNNRLIEEAAGTARTVLAVGPGLGQAEDREELVRMLLSGERAVVLDADGLNLLAKLGERLSGERNNELVLTPHPGEYRRLAQATGIDVDPVDADARPRAAAALAGAHRAVVALKGHRTIVSDGERIYINETGNAALAVGGSGDVLTGCIAGLMAQGMSGFEAAVLGVYLHGLAGDLWAGQYGPAGMTARDLAALLPRALYLRREASASR